MEGAENFAQVTVASLIRLTDIVKASTNFYKLNISNNNIIEKLNTQVVTFLERRNGQTPELASQEDLNKLYRLYEYVLGAIRKKSSTLSQIKLNRILGTASSPIVQETLNFMMEQFNLTITLIDPEEEKLTQELHSFLNFLAPSQPSSSSASLMTPTNTFRPLSPPSSTFEPIEFQYPEASNPTTSDAFINSPQEHEQPFPRYNPQAQHEPPPSPFWGLPELEEMPPAQAIPKEPNTSRGKELKKTAKAAKSKIQKSKKRSSTPHSPSEMPEESPWKGRLRERKDKSTFNRFGRT